MSQFSDNFLRPNNGLGPNWSQVFTNINSESLVGVGGIQLINNAYAPTDANGSDAYAIWTADAFGPNQYAIAQISAIAVPTSVVNITAASQSGSNTTYTYTLTSGQALFATNGGTALVITGMADAGNNGNFHVASLGAGTFTVSNAGGVTHAGQSGTGTAYSDSNCGLVVRGTPDGKNGYFFVSGSNSFNFINYDRELWKFVNGVGTQLNTSQGLPADSIGDKYGLFVVGSKIIVTKNGSTIISATDTDLTSGSPGVWTWSMSGPQEYNWANWNNPGVIGSTPPGNSGTQWTNWVGGYLSNNYTQLASDTFLEAGAILDTFQYTNGDLNTKNSNWVYEQGTFNVSSNQVFCSNAGVSFAYRSDLTPNNDQWSQIGLIIGLDASQAGSANRMATGAATAYANQLISNLSRVIKDIAGTITVLSTAATAPTGTVVSLNTTGTAQTMYQNTASASTSSDSAIASGRMGLFGVGATALTGASFWAGGNFVIPANFSSGTNQIFVNTPTNGAFALQTDAQTFGKLYENSVSWPNDQYSECVLTGAAAAATGPAVRLSATQNTGYFFFPVLGGTVRLTKVLNGVVTTLDQENIAYSSGQTYRIEVQGSTVVGKINGVIVAMAVDFDIVSGSAGVLTSSSASSPSAINSTFKNWAAGGITATFAISGNVGVAGATITWTGTSSGSTTSDASGNYTTGLILLNGSYVITPTKAGVSFSPAFKNVVINGGDQTGVNFTLPNAYSVPDCRIYAIFPNNPVNVQGTLTYTVPAHPSVTPPVDSRTQGAPVDSRVTPNIPQNSRTPGTFGPGE